ncbi:hypothetical protein V2598_10955 [Tenacibaculum maritimum]
MANRFGNTKKIKITITNFAEYQPPIVEASGEKLTKTIAVELDIRNYN